MTVAELLEPRAPYAGPTAVDARPCGDCGADVMQGGHVGTCPELGEIRRLCLDRAGRALEDLLAAATRRAWRAWTAAGGTFPGSKEGRRA